MSRLLGIVLWGAVILLTTVTGSEAACIAISKAADFSKIRKNLSGDYCLTADIDMSGVSNFTPIGLPEFAKHHIGFTSPRGPDD